MKFDIKNDSGRPHGAAPTVYIFKFRLIDHFSAFGDGAGEVEPPHMNGDFTFGVILQTDGQG